MTENDLFRDTVITRKVTPYAKLRKLRGWSQETAAAELHVSRRSLIEIERGTKDAPKDVALSMDRVYGCRGQLIDYWLGVKFSARTCEPWHRRLLERLVG